MAGATLHISNTSYTYTFVNSALCFQEVPFSLAQKLIMVMQHNQWMYMPHVARSSIR